MKKRVFSKEKCLSDDPVNRMMYDREILNEETSWIDICDGMTAYEMRKMGFLTDNDWMVDVDDNEIVSASNKSA